jgi:3-hydroxyisobutyryl-CoA hydrolase
MIVTVGGGVGVSAYAPYRIGTENTVFAMPEVKLGYFPDVGASYLLARLDGEIGTYLALTGNPISAYEVYHLGLATHYIPSRRIPSVLERLGALEALGPHTINETLNEFDTEPSSAPEAESQLSISRGEVRVALDRAFSRKDVESIIAELETFAAPESVPAEHQTDVQKWARSTLDALALRSPTSLKVTLEAVRIAGRDDFRLSDALQMELGIATAFAVRTFFPSHPFVFYVHASLYISFQKVRGQPRFRYWSEECARGQGPSG